MGDAEGPFSHVPARGGCVCVYDLDTRRAVAVLPPPSDGDTAAPLAALAFSPSGGALVAATAGKDVQLCDLAAGRRGWAAAAPGGALAERLRAMPGHVTALSMDPARGPAALLVHTPHAVCHVDLTRPVVAAAAVPQKRRRTSAPGPGHSAAAAAAAGAGADGRVILLDHLCLFAGYIGADAALLVERPWDAILRALPPPLFRHRFGV